MVDSREMERALTSASAAAAGLSQLLAIRTGVSHLRSALVRPHHSTVAAAGLLGPKGLMHCGTVAAAPQRGGGRKSTEKEEKKRKHKGGEDFAEGGGVE